MFNYLIQQLFHSIEELSYKYFIISSGKAAAKGKGKNPPIKGKDSKYQRYFDLASSYNKIILVNFNSTTSTNIFTDPKLCTEERKCVSGKLNQLILNFLCQIQYGKRKYQLYISYYFVFTDANGPPKKGTASGRWWSACAGYPICGAYFAHCRYTWLGVAYCLW